MFSTVENSVVRKVSLRLLPWLTLLYLLSYLDRSNLGNVHTTFILKENSTDVGENRTNDASHNNNFLGFITENDYGLAVSLFYIPYILFEVPSNLLLKYVSAPKWLARIITVWGIVSLSMMFVTNKAGLFACRFFLGLAEAGFFPGVIYYLSTWFSYKDRATQVAIFYIANPLSGFIGGIFGYIFMKYLDGVLSLHGWQWLFLLEGLPSIICGILTWFVLPESPSTCTFLTEEEKESMAKYLKKGEHPDNIETDTSNISLEQIKHVLTKSKLWLFCSIVTFIMFPLHYLHFFLPSIIEKFGFSSVMSNLLTAPMYVVSCLALIGNSYHSDKHQERVFHIIVPIFIQTLSWVLLLITQLNVIPESGLLAAQVTAVAVIVATAFTVIPIFFSLMNETLHGKTTHAVAFAMATGFGNIGGLAAPLITTGLSQISSNSGYPEAAMVTSCCIAIVLLFVLHIILKRETVVRINDQTPATEGKDDDRFQAL